jgi:hypothetical protein
VWKPQITQMNADWEWSEVIREPGGSLAIEAAEPVGYTSCEAFMHIDSYSFGRIEVDGTPYAKDVIIVRGEVLSPWCREAGGHVFAPDDLQTVIDAAPGTVVLGTGFFGMVKVRDETLGAFDARGTRVVVEKTSRATEVFNCLSAAGVDVAAALHLTC